MDQAVLDAARVALVELCDAGSPVLREEDIDATLATAQRRWRSFDRRHTKRAESLDVRAEDLAKGLRDAFEPDPGLVGPLMDDYRHLARVLTNVFSRAPSNSAQLQEHRPQPTT